MCKSQIFKEFKCVKMEKSSAGLSITVFSCGTDYVGLEKRKKEKSTDCTTHPKQEPVRVSELLWRAEFHLAAVHPLQSSKQAKVTSG